MTAVLAVILFATSCSTTVTPKHVHASQASFDGNVQNSGFLCFNPDGSGTITPHARDRYNALVEIYGKRLLPPVQVDEGITPAGTNYVIDAQHLNYFKRMNRWKKENK
jgi:hypothetical protein